MPRATAKGECWGHFLELYSQFNEPGFLDDIVYPRRQKLFLDITFARSPRQTERLSKYFRFEDWGAVMRLLVELVQDKKNR